MPASGSGRGDAVGELTPTQCPACLQTHAPIERRTLGLLGVDRWCCPRCGHLWDARQLSAPPARGSK